MREELGILAVFFGLLFGAPVAVSFLLGAINADAGYASQCVVVTKASMHGWFWRTGEVGAALALNAAKATVLDMEHLDDYSIQPGLEDELLPRLVDTARAGEPVMINYTIRRTAGYMWDPRTSRLITSLGECHIDSALVNLNLEVPELEDELGE